MSYNYFEIYPQSEDRKNKAPFYIEFLQFFKDDPITWKIYRRQYMHTPEELERLKEQSPKDFPWLEMCNEVHPWWLLDGTLQPEGTVPDKKWLLWFVDALNEKAEREATPPTRKLA